MTEEAVWWSTPERDEEIHARAMALRATIVPARSKALGDAFTAWCRAYQDVEGFDPVAPTVEQAIDLHRRQTRAVADLA